MCKRVFRNQTSIFEQIPFFKIGTIGKEPDAFISNELYKNLISKYSYPKSGDIIITCSGTIGKTFPHTTKCYYQDSNLVWIEHDMKYIINKFLELIISKTKWDFLSTSTIKRLYNKDIENIKINIPSISEQQKIAKFFSLLDKQIELWETKLKLNEQLYSFYKNIVFCTKKITKYSKLKYYFSILNGYPFKNSDYLLNGKYDILTIKNISTRGEIINLHQCDKINEFPSNFNNDLLIKKGDLIASLTGESGFKIALSSVDGLLNQRNIKFIQSSNIGTTFLKEYLTWNKIISYINTLGTGPQKNISTIDILNIEIPIMENHKKIEIFLQGFNHIHEKIRTRISLQKSKKKFYLNILLF